VSKLISGLPLETAAVTRANLFSALEPVRGCLKATSMLWMQAFGVPILSGVMVRNWSKVSAAAVGRFCRQGRYSELLLRIDKPYERWARRRGGFLVPISRIAATVKELQREGRIAMLLEPVSPYVDQYSLAGVTQPEQRNMIVEVVGPGFDASDILRGDIPAHERWELNLGLTVRSQTPGGGLEGKRVYLTTAEKYGESVQTRLAKIGAATRNPAFPDVVLQADNSKSALVEAGISFLKATRQRILLKHAGAYEAIPAKHLMSFVRNVERLLSGLAACGIHLGSSSFAAGVLPRRGLVFWDFFPARRQEAALLYPR